MIDSTTKFVSCARPVYSLKRNDGSTFSNTNNDNSYIFIGVNDYADKILVGAKYATAIDTNGDYYSYMRWSASVLLPASLFFLAIPQILNKDGGLYLARKDRLKLFSEQADFQSFQKSDNTNDYLLSGSNAIGRTGLNYPYSTYDANRTTSISQREITSDYVSTSDGEDWNYAIFTDLNNPDIYIADGFAGRFKNLNDQQIEIGFATYTITLNAGEENEYIARPKKYIDIVFNEIENKWFWGLYSSVNEPIDANYTMNNGDDSIDLIFYQYGFKEQSAMCFDEGGVK